MIDLNVSLRDYFAAHCPDSELPQSVSEGDIIKAFSMTPQTGERLDPDFRRSATVKIRCLARYAYADAMIEARQTKEDADESISESE
jgi:hypothetical protein